MTMSFHLLEQKTFDLLLHSIVTVIVLVATVVVVLAIVVSVVVVYTT